MNKIYRLALFAIIVMAIMPGITVAENINPTPTPPNASNNIHPTYNINNETVNYLNNEIVNGLNKEIGKESSQITVTANPLWTHTGINVNVGDTIYITANGRWTIDNYHWFGPDGFSAYTTDTFYRYANYGELIAFVGPDPYQGNWGNANFFPQSTGYWAIGSSGQFVSNKNGILWLGFNDDAVSKNTYDNFGSVSAYIKRPTAQGRVTTINRVGDCRWDVYMEATGLRPGGRIQISDIEFDYYDCQTGIGNRRSWGPVDAGYADSAGRFVFAYIHNDYGTYHYVVEDDAGNMVQIDLSYGRDYPGTTEPKIVITSPNGGENWARGTANTIVWTSTGNPGPYVRIELLKGGHPNSIISWSTQNDGSYSGTIPSTQALGNDYKVKITSTSNSAYTDTSDNNFIIDTSVTTGGLNLKNPGFEETYGSSPKYWNKYQTGTKAIFTYPETGRGGAGKSVAIKYPTKESGKVALWRQEGIAVNPSKRYKLSGYMKLEGVTGSTATPRPGGASLRVSWYKSDGGLIKTDIINKIGTNGWTKYEKIFTSPSNAVKATIGGDLFDSVGKVWFDDLSFVKLHELSNNGLQFIARHEGFRSNLYNDAGGHCTIGYGHLVHRGACDGTEPAEFISGITEQRGLELLRGDVQTAVNAVNSNIIVQLNQNQFDAMVSFAFNIGAGGFARSTVLRELNAGRYENVPTELNRYVYSGGRKIQGLVNRRNDEGALFMNPV